MTEIRCLKVTYSCKSIGLSSSDWYQLHISCKKNIEKPISYQTKMTSVEEDEPIEKSQEHDSTYINLGFSVVLIGKFLSKSSDWEA